RALPLLRRADQRSGHRSLLPSRVDDVAPLIVSPKPAPLVDSAATEIRRTLPASAAPYLSSVARREVCSPSTLGGSPVREIRSPGFVRGAALKGRPYRNSHHGRRKPRSFLRGFLVVRARSPSELREAAVDRDLAGG